MRVCVAHTLHRWNKKCVTDTSPGCEFSTGPRTNASGILVGPVTDLVLNS